MDVRRKPDLSNPDGEAGIQPDGKIKLKKFSLSLKNSKEIREIFFFSRFWRIEILKLLNF